MSERRAEVPDQLLDHQGGEDDVTAQDGPGTSWRRSHPWGGGKNKRRWEQMLVWEKNNT